MNCTVPACQDDVFLTPGFLKVLGSEITKLLTVLCNLWFGVSSNLEGWKDAYDIPIFRKNFRENPETAAPSL